MSTARPPTIRKVQSCGRAKLAETNYSDIAEMIASKAARGWDLYLSRHRRIQRLGEDTYSVSSSSSGGKDSYSRYPCSVVPLVGINAQYTRLLMHRSWRILP